jgi:ribosomal protein S18 acetylase RimI-like enzyme
MAYIRQATRKDLQLLVEMGKRTFYETFAAENNPEDMANYLGEAFSEERIQQELLILESVFLLIQDTPEAVLPLGYARLVGESLLPGMPMAEPIEVSRLYLEAAAIGQGYGSQLMQACLDYGMQQGFQTIWLGVWEKNFRAQRFYERWGFRRVGSMPFQLGRDIQTDWVMLRSLSASTPDQFYSPDSAESSATLRSESSSLDEHV